MEYTQTGVNSALKDIRPRAEERARRRQEEAQRPPGTGFMSERTRAKAFLETLVALDTEKCLHKALFQQFTGPIRTLIRIYLPLSTSVLATLSLFYAVGRWNGFSDALMYMSSNRYYYPIQLLLYQILQSTTQIEIATQEGFFPPGISETLKMATVMFATVPIIMIYPWLQRYFISGVTIGAIKG